MTTPIREPHELAILGWVELVLVTLDPEYAGRVRFARQDAQHSSRPYAIVTLISESAEGHPARATEDAPGTNDPTKFVHYVWSDRTVTFSVSIYGDNARSHLRQLELALEDDATDAYLYAQAQALSAGSFTIRRPISSIVDPEIIRRAQWDSLASVDFEAGFVALRTQEIPAIESVAVTSTEPDFDGFDETFP